MATLGVVLTMLIMGSLIGFGLRRRARRPAFRLRHSFSALAKNILRDIEGAQRASARRLLAQSEAHLNRLVRAQEQQQLLRELASAGSALTGTGVKHSVAESERMKVLIGEQLELFFSSLSKIAAAVALRHSDALDSLQAFAEQQEEQQRALLELTKMLDEDRRYAALESNEEESALHRHTP
ncbi:MAG: hypothetical protein RBU37_11755 [Myxococcota bacterium]|jgi:hypothetical protein|nr:hypothetical protein [Myxococcota bacterium]